MGFVDDDVLPSELPEVGLFAEDHLVTGDADVKVLVDQPVVDELVALLLGTLQDEHVDIRGPLGELPLPVVQGRLGHDDQVRARDSHDVAQVAQEGDGLQGLAQTHLVGKNARNAVLVKRDQPVQTGDLVVPHGAVDEGGRVAEDGLGGASVLLVLKQLGIFFGFGPAASIASRTALATSALLLLGRLFILAIDLGHNIANLRIRVRFDEVAKEVGETEQVSEPAKCVILLFKSQPTTRSWSRPKTLCPTFDSPSLSCFLPKMLLRS